MAIGIIPHPITSLQDEDTSFLPLFLDYSGVTAQKRHHYQYHITALPIIGRVVDLILSTKIWSELR